MKNIVNAIAVLIMSAVFGFFIGSMQWVIGTGAWGSEYFIVPFFEGGIAGAVAGLVFGPIVYYVVLQRRVTAADWLIVGAGTAAVSWVSAYLVFRALGNGAITPLLGLSLAGLALTVRVAKSRKRNGTINSSI